MNFGYNVLNLVSEVRTVKERNDYYPFGARQMQPYFQWVAFLERENAISFMKKLNYKYLMTQFTEDSKSYMLSIDKGRNRMADVIYGDVTITVEKATYIQNDKDVYSYRSLNYLKEPIIKNYILTFYRESSIRYSKPFLLDKSWNSFWNLVKGYSKFGSEYDYRNRYVKYKKSSLR